MRINMKEMQNGAKVTIPLQHYAFQLGSKNQRLAEKGGVKRKRDEHCDYRPNLVETNKAIRGHMLDKDNGRFEEMESVERGADGEINLFMNGIIQYTHEYRNQRH